MKSKIMAIIIALTLVLSLTVAFAGSVSAAPKPSTQTPVYNGWNVTGSWNINVVDNSDNIVHPETLILTQIGATITGVSLNSNPPVSASAFTITSGTISGNAIVFHASYNPNSSNTMIFSGTIATDGSMSGTWYDEPGFLDRTGTWATTTGKAAPATFVTVKGIEICAGTVNKAGNRIGATFVAQPTDPYNGGAMLASTNYQGPSPNPGGSNNLIGGFWTLTVTNNGKWLGTISGNIPAGGMVDWYPKAPSTPGTDYGIVTTLLTITSKSGVFNGVTSANFVGQDLHASKFYIGKIEVPVITGIITFSY